MKEQEHLDLYYKDILTQTNLSDFKDLDRLSAPFLLKVYDSYLNSDKKIMFVGKETNHWLTHSSRDEDKKGLKYLINNYEEAYQTLIKRYEKALIDNSQNNKSAFFSEYKYIQKELGMEELGNIVWNNLFKLAYDQNKGFSKNSKTHLDVVALSKKIFLKELKILKPDILIFVTGSSYDKSIKNTLKEYETIDVHITKRLWKFKYKDIICYRTIHPHYYRLNHKKENNNYYNLIAEDIKQNNSGKMNVL
jgi:hypothetical protein